MRQHRPSLRRILPHDLFQRGVECGDGERREALGHGDAEDVEVQGGGGGGVEGPGRAEEGELFVGETVYEQGDAEGADSREVGREVAVYCGAGGWGF